MSDDNGDPTFRDFLVSLAVLALLALLLGCSSVEPIDGRCVGGPKHGEACAWQHECWGGACAG